MTSQASYGSRMMFQTINDDLNASLATADELSREFDTLLKETSPSTTYPPSNNNTTSGLQTNLNSNGSSSYNTSSPHPSNPLSSTMTSTLPRPGTESYSYGQLSPKHSPVSQRRNSPGRTSPRSISPQRDPPGLYDRGRTMPTPQVYSTNSPSSPRTSTAPRTGSEGYSYGQYSPKHSPLSRRRDLPGHPDVSRGGSTGYMDRSPLASPMTAPFDPMPRSGTRLPSPHLLSPYDSTSMGRRSPSPLSVNHPAASMSLPRNYASNEGVQRQKTPSKWNETDLDMSYEQKPHHTYEKTEWLRPSMPNSSWRESNLDGPPPPSSPKKDPRSGAPQFPQSSLSRNTRLTVPPDPSSPSNFPYHPQQPIISRISIPPTSSENRKRKPIPLSVIMRLQNPHWRAMTMNQSRMMGRETDMSPHQTAGPVPREYFKPGYPPQQHLPEMRQPTIYSDVLNPADIEAELERLDYIYHIPVIPENPSEVEQGTPAVAPRPLSPTRLQPVVASEAQIPARPDIEEVLRIRAEIPRALKRRGSVDTQPLKQASHYQPNQYKHLIDKLFRRKELRQRGERGSDTSSSSEEECAMPPAPVPQTSNLFPQDFRNYHSILRRSSKERRGTGNRARLSPLVLLLDGSLVGELETVQKAVQEMNDPSHPNDEGITALHNAVCGGHYNVVDFLVRIGANVSAPDSHGWTPLHCAASCNDRPLCEFLVRNGAAVMAMTESDGAMASHKCDPFAINFEECESYLKGVEEAMGVENSGVLYALWSYPAQEADELSFREGDMVTILQKPEGGCWWWASLCGREGCVPSNYFGLFPKIRPKTLC